uniref:Octanoyltransferase n=1 Tax=Candidatus Aschnera chinzeii TaxID=1485666 RepID=A0AAT9G575_9ENTR|nr:MAG: lipoyl(octanoyl) transferase LipB [Candidatus Aschnera chinzeii]
MDKIIYLRQLGLQNYQYTYNNMYDFTINRTHNTIDEIWLVEHYPIFTIGKSGTKKDIISPTNIPVIFSNRGGKITYHGPGQQILYVLLDLKRNNLNIKTLVKNLEKIIIYTLHELGLNAYFKNNAPGVYIQEKKICSIGLRIHKGCSLHGLALNINMDMSPFNNINPCGYHNISMAQLIDFIPTINYNCIIKLLIKYFCYLFKYRIINECINI